jgi:hypothetical protein
MHFGGPVRWSVMVHASSLRVIGQILESGHATVFELEKHGQYYVTWSDSLTDAAIWISCYGLIKNPRDAGARESKADRSLCFDWADISRLDSHANKRRRHQSTAYVEKSNKLPQLLRTVGDHLDRNSISAFHLSWTPERVCILTLPTSELVVERFTLTPEKLQQLSLHTKIRRSRRPALRLCVN